ncbi:putative NADP-dependent oxidoreductase YfmJ [Chlamydiales bacterium STE3]|nr:putative NADP-dependent oxidoreductase YfmJ [Chlamydiales bacterium STE3]
MSAHFTNKQVILTSYPEGLPSSSTFAFKETPLPPLQEEDVLIQSLYLSVDPYMRLRMFNTPSYTDPFQLNHPLTGGVVGRVVESKHPHFRGGDIVLGHLDWALYNIAKGKDLEKIDPSYAPISTALGVLGMPGMTAYFGLLDIGRPKEGETVVVSGAAGAVGMIAGQIAKLKGCRVVGIAGTQEKIDYITNTLGFDSGINYKSAQFSTELYQACPKGVDIYYDNVGGDVTDQVMKLINWHARLVISGQISMYNLNQPDIGPRHFRTLIAKSALAKGFIVTQDYKERFQEGIQQVAEWMMQGKIKYIENIVEGLENAPKAFLGLFSGENLGKQIVKIAN